MPLQHDARGPYLLLSPAEAAGVTAALTLAGVAFQEDDGPGAGCAGPEVVVLRLEPAPDLAARVGAALAAGE